MDAYSSVDTDNWTDYYWYAAERISKEEYNRGDGSLSYRDDWKATVRFRVKKDPAGVMGYFKFTDIEFDDRW